MNLIFEVLIYNLRTKSFKHKIVFSDSYKKIKIIQSTLDIQIWKLDIGYFLNTYNKTTLNQTVSFQEKWTFIL